MMKNNYVHTLIPYPVIEAAAQGDASAIGAVLNHYAIAALSIRPFLDKNGTVHMVVDPEMKRRLETKLITRIVKFKVA